MVKGLNNIVNRLKSLATSNEQQVYTVLKNSAQPIVTDAQSQIPVKTGNLRASVGFIERNKRYKKAVIIGPRTYGGWKGYHAHLIAKGWKRQRYDGQTTIVPGIDFMTNAFNRNATSVKNNIEQQLAALLKKQLK
jgi:HK97 gp10 family phage protein